MPLPQETRYTYADYLTWNTEEKYELFDGTPTMQARPNIQHQRISAALMHQLMAALDGKPCQALAEIEVLLPDYPEQNINDITNFHLSGCCELPVSLLSFLRLISRYMKFHQSFWIVQKT